ncbi:hypothetical protein ACFWG6_22985 [Streptomyces erythrochromogenes]|uniref:hypothetical protein n=1 Tax=Streptomyces erythrochromogenes TaxID=285574 RepID=UPI0004CDB1C4|nr:hypothetical protein [Streptomyces erythrochromogenes]
MRAALAALTLALGATPAGASAAAPAPRTTGRLPYDGSTGVGVHDSADWYPLRQVLATVVPRGR